MIELGAGTRHEGTAMTTRADGDVGDRVSGATLDDLDDFAGTSAAVVRRSSGAIGSSLGPPLFGGQLSCLGCAGRS